MFVYAIFPFPRPDTYLPEQHEFPLFRLETALKTTNREPKSKRTYRLHRKAEQKSEMCGGNMPKWEQSIEIDTRNDWFDVHTIQLIRHDVRTH